MEDLKAGHVHPLHTSAALARPPCPALQYQDSISALSDLSASYYSSFHTYGVDWQPGKVGGARGGHQR